MFGGPNQNFTWGKKQDPMANFSQLPPGTTRDQALAMVGKPANFSYTGSIDRDLDAYYGMDMSGRSGDYGATGDVWGSASGGGGGASSIGGVSAVNPQAGQANELDAFRRYEDSAYSDAMRRLEPQMQKSQRDFDQEMVNRGIPIGSEAYNSAKANFEQNKSGALQDAAFGAMKFGLGAQNQSFQQDFARSNLANALLRAQWQKELGLGNLGLGYAQLGEQGRQFDQGLGRDYDFFYDTLGQRNYEFDAGQDFDYWDRGNFWDYSFDRANADDYFSAYDRDFGQQAYYNDLLLSLFGPAPGVQGQSGMGAYGSQMGSATRPGFDFLSLMGFL